MPNSSIPAAGKAVRDRSAPEYAEAWGKCRSLGKELSQALADTGDVEFGLILPAGWGCAVSFGQLQDDTRHPAEFPMQTINRLAARIALILGDDPNVTAERVVITSRGVHTQIKTPGLIDPLVEAIDDYQAGCKVYAEHPDVDKPDADEDAIAEAAYGQEMRALQNWSEPALTPAGALAALQIIRDERLLVSGIGEPLLIAAIRYLEAL